MNASHKYEVVIGLEVHAQLLTKTKAFSSDPNQYGSSPNTNVSPISLGHPGTLPKPNIKALDYALRMGLALNCTINRKTWFARKNYFYADLPKGYQITQFPLPICTDGHLTITAKDGKPLKVEIEKIILEEDSGKSIHDLDPFSSLVDLNRAGVPLIEIVSGPDMRHPEEAYNYLTEIRRLVRYLDICDGNMEEGSLRCDANVSVMLKGSNVFGTKVEVKNMNSIRNVQRALEYEIKRQVETLEHGGRLVQETRTFDAGQGTTISMRSKEMAHDYRYFPEPDIPPIVVKDELLEQVRNAMPELPDVLFERFTTQYGLSEYDAALLTAEKGFANFFAELITHTKNYKAAANWINGAVRSYLNENGIDIAELGLKSEKIAQLIELVEQNKVSSSVASSRIFPVLAENPEKNPEQIAQDLNLIQVSDEGEIESWVKQAVEKNPSKVEEYKSGKKGLMGYFMGEVMKASRGKADPKKSTQLLMKELEK